LVETEVELGSQMFWLQKLNSDHEKNKIIQTLLTSNRKNRRNRDKCYIHLHDWSLSWIGQVTLNAILLKMAFTTTSSVQIGITYYTDWQIQCEGYDCTDVENTYMTATDWIGYKSNDHTRTTTTAPYLYKDRQRMWWNKQIQIALPGKRALIWTNPIQHNLIKKICNATNIADITDITK
jgi:hypothetical protein